MADMFKLSDIKAGYLLVVKGKNDGKKFNMTVVPAKGLRPSPFAAFLGLMPTEDGDLACCGGEDFWPLNNFDNDLKTADNLKFCRKFEVVKVYGYANPDKLLSNTTNDRELLWEREAVAEAEAEEPEWLNGKVVCVANEYRGSIPVSGFTVGKVYTLKDGRITSDNGWTSRIPAETVENLCRGIGHTFIPFVGEQE